MKTTKYEIKLPTLPDGHEFIGVDEIRDGDMMVKHNDNTGEIKWVDARGHWGRHGILARRRETLAGWANKQRLFQALAEMRKGKETIIETSGACVWGFGADKHGDWYDFEMGTPPANLTGKLRLEAGKWVDAT